jgi:catechol 2,3-dioxygenase-like lactoylglutathione lyase family enzyme
MSPQYHLVRRSWLLFFLGGAIAVLLIPLLARGAASTEEKKTVQFTHACIITQNLETLRDFYREVLQVEPKVYQEDYLEFPLEGAILSLYRQESLERTVPGAMQAGRNQSVMLEFQVADVDREYARLKKAQVPIDWVMAPITFPWGNRSIYFRDPEGNMVNLYSRVKSSTSP